mmetsp:Transcript_5439/g.8599  ORF Transcript_5439/g.8599 Transcript_5439/m.8599 type:complete len:134 (-) Transcript_5439:355-756(-)
MLLSQKTTHPTQKDFSILDSHKHLLFLLSFKNTTEYSNMTPTNKQQPLATTSATVTVADTSSASSSPFVSIKFVPAKKNFAHSPVIKAMLENNRLTNCQDVMNMMQECSRVGSEDQVCQTAARYMETCLFQQS